MKQKFYVLSVHNTDRFGGTDLDVYLFRSKEHARIKMNFFVDEAFGKDCDAGLQANGFVVERGKDFVSIYEEGSYKDCHFDVNIQEVELQ